MILLTKYQIHASTSYYYVTSDEIHTCPLCQGPLIIRDSKRRKVIFAENDIRYFRFRRLRCANCGRLHTELPDFVAPYRHYSRTVIEAALNDSQTCCSAENSTIYRWRKTLK